MSHLRLAYKAPASQTATMDLSPLAVLQSIKQGNLDRDTAVKIDEAVRMLTRLARKGAA